MTFDPTASSILIVTRAEGLLSGLAHDLRIEATGGSGEVRDGVAEVSFPALGLRVREASKPGKDRWHMTDDARAIEQRLHEEVFKPHDLIRVIGSSSTIEVITPSGREAKEVATHVRDGVARGTTTLSLTRLGISHVKGPLGVIRLRDAVEVTFRAVFK